MAFQLCFPLPLVPNAQRMHSPRARLQAMLTPYRATRLKGLSTNTCFKEDGLRGDYQFAFRMALSTLIFAGALGAASICSRPVC